MKLFSLKRLAGKLLVGGVCLLGISRVLGAAGDVDPNFNASAYGQLNGPVHVIKKQSDGKYLVGGNFYDVNGVAASGLFRLNADLTPDSTFDAPDFTGGLGLGGTIHAIGLQSDGKIIVAGDLSGTDGVYHPGLKRLFPNGALDPGFNPPPPAQSAIYYDIEILPDNKIFAGGQRLNADGTVDNTFGGAISSAKETELQPDGKILAGTTTYRRYNTDGTVDNGFAPVTTNGTINSIVYLADGKSLIGGDFSQVNGFQQGGIARINADGTVDLTFNMNQTGFSSGMVTDINPRTDGKFLVAGYFFTYNGFSKNRLALINPDGSADGSFQTTIPAQSGFWANDVEVLPNGKVLGGFDSNFILNTMYLFNADGTFDNSLNLVVSRGGSVSRIARQPDGKILAVGTFLYAKGAVRRSIARFNADGSLDPSFVPYFSNVFTLNAVAVQPDGKILVGAFLGPVLVRLNPDGSQDTGFSTTLSASSVINDIAVLPDGKILAAGDIGGDRVVRLNANGATDGSFTDSLFNGGVNKLLVQPDGKILVGGAFTVYGLSLRGRIARLNPDGTLDNTFNPPGGANGEVRDLDLQPDGKVVLVGAFAGLNGGMNQNLIGRLNADGSLDSSFVQHLAVDGYFIGLKIQSDGRIVVVGQFQIHNLSKLGIVRFKANGAVDPSFNTFVNTGGLGVFDVELQADGKILIGGGFTRVNGVSTVRIARLNNVAPADVLFDYDGDGRSDVSVFRPSENCWYILRSSDGNVLQIFFGAAGDRPAPSDFDGDGKTDLAIFRPSTGDWWYRSSINTAQISVHFGQSGDIPLPSDFDGNGYSDFVVYRPSTGVWYRLGNGGQTSILAFGASGDKPLIGDFDGDGKSDVAIFRPSTGDWWYASSISGQFLAVHWGQAGDIPVPADYDGDAKTDFAVFRPADGGWYIFNSGNGSFTTLAFGISTDKPIAADYDGDGRADVAVFRPSEGLWYLLQSTAGLGGSRWGIASDIPTQNAFVP